MNKNILIIGPFSPPITGNSLANDVALKGLNNKENLKVDSIDTQFETFKNDTGNFSFTKTYFYFKKYAKLYKIFRKDIIYITPGQTFFGVLKYAPFIYLGKLLNKKIIIHIHGNYLKTQYDLLSGFRKSVFANVLKKADKGIVLSNSLIPNLSPFLPPERICVIQNFVEESLRPANFEVKKNETLKIVYLSNLMIEKGVLDLLEALTKLTNKGIKFEAKLAGNIETSIKTQLQSFFELKEIEYLGVVEGVVKKKLLEWSNIFVLPTYYKMEGVPISILEAMANGNIIITTEHGGIKDIISEKNGFFIKPKSPDDIADKLFQIDANIEHYDTMRMHNIEKSKDFSEQNFIDNLVKVFIN